MINEYTILILNTSPKTFRNNETGEVNDMALVTYGRYCEPTEYFNGYAIFEGYLPAKALEVANKYVGKNVKAKIREIPQKNGVKYSLQELNNEKLR